jgi:hypothetical protein
MTPGTSRIAVQEPPVQHATIPFLALAVLALLSGAADADRPGRGAEGRGSLSAEQAAEQARQRFGGRILDVRPMRSSDERSGYRVKLLDRGEVRSVIIPGGPDNSRGRGKGRARPHR